MPDVSPEMIRRRDAAQATLDGFKDKPFKWGQRDCARLAATHLRRFGYKVKLPPAGAYSSRRSAAAALAKYGYRSVIDAVEALGLERIPAAAAWVGDLVTGESEDGMGAIGVYLGNGRIVGYHPEAPGAAVLQPQYGETFIGWRVTPK